MLKNNIIVISIIALLSIACQDENLNGPRNIGSGVIANSLPPDPIFDDLINEYDTTNIVGVIDVFYEKSEHENLILRSTSGTYLSSQFVTVNSISANFSNDHFTTFFPVDSLKWEGFLFQENTDALYHYFLDGKNAIKWADSNLVELDSNTYIDDFSTKVYISDAIEFSNISFGDTINATSNLTLNWSGYSNEYASINFINTRISRDSSFSTSSAIFHNDFTEDDGSFTVSSSDLSSLAPGQYKLQLTSFEPRIISLDNGDKVFVLVTAKHSITVYI